MNKPNGADLTRIALDTYEDPEGMPWIWNAQTGWVRVEANGRATQAARKLRTLLRLRGKYPVQVAAIAKRLDGSGWWASHAIATGWG